GAVWHLASNAIGLVVLGRLVERVFGARALGFCLIASALGGSALSAAGGEEMVGASGAVCGLAGMLATGLRGPGLPPGLGAVMRRRIFFVMGIRFALGFALNRAQAAVQVSNLAHLGGFAAGLVAGFITPAPLVPASPARRSTFKAATTVTLVAAEVLAFMAVYEVARASGALDGGFFDGGGFGGDFRAGGPLRHEALPELGLAVDIPEGWSAYKRGKSGVIFGPQEGAPFFQIFVTEIPPGAFAPDLVDPDVLAATTRQDLEAAGARDVISGPIAADTIGGLRATRMETRYSLHGMRLQQIRYEARGGRTLYSVLFLGRGTSAEKMAAALAPRIQVVRRAE
ncbi:MAG TPA: rhomboid family intramembrane serine protease, partial [Planctomycetota bacterium]|nr:rhomboid family intramembrane serine protease [Planctomycetota bacterium]